MFWFDSWLVLAGLVISIALTLTVVIREDWRGVGPIVVAVMVVTFIACLPSALMRMGIALEIGSETTVVYVNLIATLVAVVVGGSRLYARIRAESALPTFVNQADFGDGAPSGQTGDAGTLTAMEHATPEQALPGTGWLHFTAGPRTGQSIPLPAGTITIGRAIDNDVVLDDATVSRSHATIGYRDGEYYIEDAGSMSGTMVEGAPAATTMLASGATLQMGEAEMVFMRTGAVGPADATGFASMRTGGTGPGGSARGGTGVGRPGETVVLAAAQDQVMAWLAVTAGPSKGKSYQLKEGDNTIGRSPDNDLVLEANAASRNHAMVRVQDGRFVLVDLGSSGGTRVGGHTVSGRSISPGGVLTVGQTRLRLVAIEGQEGLPPGTLSGQTIVDTPGGGSAVLIAQSGPDSGKSFLVSVGDTAIGREPGSQVLLTDEAISRRHALVRSEADGFMVFDLGSRSGTQVGNETVRGHDLAGGDSISIGRSEVVLMRPGS